MRILRHSVAVGLINRRDAATMRKRTSCQGRDGTGILGRCLDVLPAMAEDTDSGTEVLYLELCETWELPPPVLQLPVIANGNTYRVDFAYPAQRAFIEIDGGPHDDPIRIAMDGGRQNDLVVLGWQPIRLHYDQMVHQPERCAATVRRLLAAASSQLPRSVNL